MQSKIYSQGKKLALLSLVFLYGITKEIGPHKRAAMAAVPATLSVPSKGLQEKADNRVAFLVNNEAVFTKVLNDRLRFAALSLGMSPTREVLEKLRPSVIQTLTNEILQRQMALKMGLTLDEKAVEKTLESIEEGNQMKPGGLKAFFKTNNLSEEVLKNQIRSNLLWMDYIRKKYEYSLTVTPQEAETFLKRFEAKQQKTLYNLAEIVLYVNDTQYDASVKQQANQIVEWLRGGAPFPKVAYQFSQSASKNQGGLLGWVSENDLEEEVIKALHSLMPGMLSVPIRTASGYVILAFIDRKDPSKTASPPPNKNQVMDLLRSEHLERLARRELSSLQKKMTLEIRE